MTKRIQHNSFNAHSIKNRGKMSINTINSILRGQKNLISIDNNNIKELTSEASKAFNSFGFGDTFKDVFIKSINNIAKGHKQYGATKAIIKLTSDNEENLNNFSIRDQLYLLPRNCHITYRLNIKEETTPKVVFVVAKGKKNLKFIEKKLNKEIFLYFCRTIIELQTSNSFIK